MAVGEEVEDGLKKIIKSLPSSLESIIKAFKEGGPLSAVGAAATSVGSSILEQEAYQDQRDAINDATAKYMAGIEQLIALENIFADEQLTRLQDAFGLTEAQIQENLRTDPQFIVEAYQYVEDTFDPQITDRFSDSINQLSEGMRNLTEDQLTAFEGAMTDANGLLEDSDRNLHFGYDEAGNQLSVAKGVITSGIGEASNIIGALDNFGQEEIQGGMREALGLGQDYIDQGQAGLGAFSDTALNPNSELFQRNLGLAQESLNQQLASRGLLDSGAAIEAQSELIQGMTLEEMQRQTGLQQTLAEMGQGQISNAQQLISSDATQRVQLAKDLGLVQADYVMSSAQDLAEIDKALAQNMIQEAVQKGELTAQQAQNIMQTGQLQGGGIADYMNTLSQVQSSASSQVLQSDLSQEQQIASARQEAVMKAVDRGMSLQDALTQFPLEQFQQEFNVDRGRLDQISDLEVGQMNREQEALTALANIEGMDQLGLAEALRTMGGGKKTGGGSSVESGVDIDLSQLFKDIGDSNFVQTLMGGGDFRSALATLPAIGNLFDYNTDPNSGPTPDNTTVNPNSGINFDGGRQDTTSDFSWMNDMSNDPFFNQDPVSTTPTNDMNGYDPSSQDMPSMTPSPTDDHYFDPSNLDVEVMRGKAGFDGSGMVKTDTGYITQENYDNQVSNPNFSGLVMGPRQGEEGYVGMETMFNQTPEALRDNAQVSEDQRKQDYQAQLQSEIGRYQNQLNESVKGGQRPNYALMADAEIAIQQRQYMLENPNATEMPNFSSQYAGNVRGGYTPPSFNNYYTPSQEYTQTMQNYQTHLDSQPPQRVGDSSFFVDGNGKLVDMGGTMQHGGQEVTDPKQRMAILEMQYYKNQNPDANYTNYYSTTNGEQVLDGGWGDSGLRDVYNNLADTGIGDQVGDVMNGGTTTPTTTTPTPNVYLPTTLPEYDFMGQGQRSVVSSETPFTQPSGFSNYLETNQTNRADSRTADMGPDAVIPEVTPTNPYNNNNYQSFRPQGFRTQYKSSRPFSKTLDSLPTNTGGQRKVEHQRPDFNIKHY